MGVSPMQPQPQDQTFTSQPNTNETATPVTGHEQSVEEALHGRDAHATHGQDARATPLRWLSDGVSAVLVLMVRVYQLTLRPILGGQCRFVPTCSEYFIQAVRLRGPVVGAALGVWRILRCHPFGKSGYDPVPEPERRNET